MAFTANIHSGEIIMEQLLITAKWNGNWEVIWISMEKNMNQKHSTLIDAGKVI